MTTINNIKSVPTWSEQIKSQILASKLDNTRDKIWEILDKWEERNIALRTIRNEILPKARINADTAIIDILEILNSLDYSLSENNWYSSEIYKHFLMKFAKLAKGNYDERFNDSFRTYTEALEVLWIKWIDRDTLEEFSKF